MYEAVSPAQFKSALRALMQLKIISVKQSNVALVNPRTRMQPRHAPLALCRQTNLYK